MPNWITNKIQAASHVIRAIVNDKGHVDFNLIQPFGGPFKPNGIFLDAEDVAEMACGKPVDSHPILGALQSSNRQQIDLRKMTDESFEQVIGMLRNYRATGYLHEMDFARAVWGTKWNACASVVNAAAGTCQFDTAWSCPQSALTKLSQQFPNEPIFVTYADEEIGHNCGQFQLMGGKITEQDIAPGSNEMTPQTAKKWRDFAYQVKGYSQEEVEIREAERA